MLDTVLAVHAIAYFLIQNIYGWGILHEKAYISLFLFFGLLFMSLTLIKKNVRPDRKYIFFIRFSFLIVFMALSVLGNTVSFMRLRNRTATTGFITDSALQIEIAGKMLLHGKNPYTESYQNTDLSSWNYRDEAGGTTNPALSHLVYPPFLIAASSVAYVVLTRLFGWYDIRVLYVLGYIGLGILSWKHFGRTQNLLLFFSMVLLNPLFITFMTQGTNDIVVLFFLLSSMFFLEKKSYTLSAVILGLSFATKQTAWLFLPGVLYFLVLLKKNIWRRYLLISMGSAGLFYVPFLLWDYQALLGDVISFLAGTSGVRYPIQGYGVSVFLVALKIIPTIYSYFPFWIMQGIVGVPLLYLTSRFIRTNRNICSILYAYSVLVFSMGYFGRYLNDTHLAYILVCFASAWVWDNGKKEDVYL